jgi:putative tricarboxylic transport membrane protein
LGGRRPPAGSIFHLAGDTDQGKLHFRSSGPKTFPIIIGILVGLSSLAILLKPDDEPEWPDFSRFFEIGLTVAVMLAYAYALPVAGFVVSTAVAASYLSWRLGTPPAKAAIAGIAISVGIYAVFHLILGLSLARGPWGF